MEVSTGDIPMGLGPSTWPMLVKGSHDPDLLAKVHTRWLGHHSLGCVNSGHINGTLAGTLPVGPPAVQSD